MRHDNKANYMPCTTAMHTVTRIFTFSISVSNSAFGDFTLTQIHVILTTS